MVDFWCFLVVTNKGDCRVNPKASLASERRVEHEGEGEGCQEGHPTCPANLEVLEWRDKDRGWWKVAKPNQITGGRVIELKLKPEIPKMATMKFWIIVIL